MKRLTPIIVILLFILNGCAVDKQNRTLEQLEMESLNTDTIIDVILGKYVFGAHRNFVIDEKYHTINLTEPKKSTDFNVGLQFFNDSLYAINLSNKDDGILIDYYKKEFINKYGEVDTTLVSNNNKYYIWLEGNLSITMSKDEYIFFIHYEDLRYKQRLNYGTPEFVPLKTVGLDIYQQSYYDSVVAPKDPNRNDI